MLVSLECTLTAFRKMRRAVFWAVKLVSDRNQSTDVTGELFEKLKRGGILSFMGCGIAVELDG